MGDGSIAQAGQPRHRRYNGFERADDMAPIKGKQTSDEVAPRCPNCDERVPEGARRRTMCGRSLADVATEAARERAGDPPER